jgi:cytochrome c553
MNRHRISRWGAPVTYVGAVVIVGLTLVAILTRSPDTKSNYQASGSSYRRTELASFSGPEQYPGLRHELGDPRTTFVGAGCANCHGLQGEGGSVGPEIWTKSLKDVTSAVREGPNGMPAFTADRLSDQQIAAIGTYLHDQRTSHPDEPARKPARAGAGGAAPSASPTATPAGAR